MGIGTWSRFHSPYNEREVLSFVPNKPGVYVLWAHHRAGEWRCFYVGNADDLEGGLLSHLSVLASNPCLKEHRKNKCGFQWMMISTEAERAAVEKYLYDVMGPECNPADPGGAPLQVPLPPTPSPTTPTND